MVAGRSRQSKDDVPWPPVGFDDGVHRLLVGMAAVLENGERHVPAQRQRHVSKLYKDARREMVFRFHPDKFEPLVADDCNRKASKRAHYITQVVNEAWTWASCHHSSSSK